MNKREIEIVSWNLSNFMYHGNLEATKQLMELLEIVDVPRKRRPNNPEDYIDMYDWNFYTYSTWEELVKSEIEQGNYGLTEEECKEQLNKTIWKLPCGWYVQYV